MHYAQCKKFSKPKSRTLTERTLISVFASLWGGLFLERAYGFSYLQATQLIALVPFGFAFGGTFFGWINARYIATKHLTCLSSLAMLGLSLGIIFCGGSAVGLITCFLILAGFI